MVSNNNGGENLKDVDTFHMENEEEKETTDLEFKYLKLTPVEDANIKPYKDALDQIFDDDDLRNIAITAPYGAGKTSVLKTYQKESAREMFYISLANFKTNTIDEKNEKNLIHILEAKIINHLIHQISYDEIPETRFRIKKKSSYERPQSRDLAFLIVCTILLFIIPPFKGVNYWNFTWNPGFAILDYIAFFNFCFWSYLSYLILIPWIQYLAEIGYELKKIKLYGHEIDLASEKMTDSCFDKYLDEIIYIFEQSKVKTIVFEDIDRYDGSIEVFSRLREINSLINSKPSGIKKNAQCFCYKPCESMLQKFKNKIFEENQLRPPKGVVRFFYLVRDDIFQSKDRTKFFDFIIPILPIANKANSFDKLKENLEKSPYGLELTTDNKIIFLKRLSYYIDDLRLLSNIVNEFTIFSISFGKVLEQKSLHNQQLFALIVYKNLLPLDFNSLILGKGYLWNIFASKNKYIDPKREEIKKELEEKKQLLEKSEADHLKSTNELIALYLSTNAKLYRLTESGNELEFLGVAHIEQLRSASKIHIFMGQGHGKQNITFDEILKKLNTNKDFVERKKMIELKNEAEKEQILEEIKLLEISLKKIQTAKLSELLVSIGFEEMSTVDNGNTVGVKNEVDNGNKVEAKNEVNIGSKNEIEDHKELVKFLLINSYIDENYPNYLAEFTEDNLSASDRNFVMKLTVRESLGFDYELKKPQTIIFDLVESDFTKAEILNFDLLNYLLGAEKYQHLLIMLINQIQEEKQLKFVCAYLEKYPPKSDNTSSFVRMLNRESARFSFDFLSESWISTELKQRYLKILLLKVDSNRLQVLNKESIMTSSIQIYSDFLSGKYVDEILSDEEKNVFINSLSNLAVKFSMISYEESDKSLFEMAYEEKLYEINLNMILLILNHIYKLDVSNEPICNIYSLILSKPEEALSRYIEESDNIDILLTELLGYTGNFSDTEEAVQKILNSKQILEEKKNDYISKLSTIINSIELIEKGQNIWHVLVEQKKVKDSMENIVHYFIYSGYTINYFLTKVINSKEDFSDFQPKNIEEILGDGLVKLELEFLKKEEINSYFVKKYFELLNSPYNEFTETDIQTDRLAILIETGTVNLGTKGIIPFLRDNYPDLITSFLLKNQAEYLTDCLEEFPPTHEELVLLLDKVEILDADKIKLLETNSEEFDLENVDYSDQVKAYIIDNNLKRDNLTYLISEYEKSPDKIKDSIFIVCIQNLSYLCEEVEAHSPEIPISLLLKIIEKKDIDTAENQKLINNAIKNNCSITEAKKLFTEATLEVFTGVLNGRKDSLIEINEANTRTLNLLLDQKWIESFYPDSEKDNFYLVNKKKKEKFLD